MFAGILLDAENSRFSDLGWSVNPFHATDLFWYPLKQNKQRLSEVFRGHQKRSVAWNGLILEKETHLSTQISTQILPRSLFVKLSLQKKLSKVILITSNTTNKNENMTKLHSTCCKILTRTWILLSTPSSWDVSNFILCDILSGGGTSGGTARGSEFSANWTLPVQYQKRIGYFWDFKILTKRWYLH